MLPRILAVYLPQFHITEDNNKWWGEGFTDWESVKRAEPCFAGHNAPWVPIGGQYYDLSDPNTMKYQAELAKKYGIDGFCFYHYYFKNGKKELELPAELLLKNKEINMPFCFNWASESWIRSWSHISGNVWSEKFEQECTNNVSGILVEQDYGSESEWTAHFNYLLPFFRDDRYIKINNKPVFIFYNPDDIKPLKAMAEKWRELAIMAGLNGLYLISVNSDSWMNHLDASLIYEPRNAFNKLNSGNKAQICDGVRCFEYKAAWEAVLQSVPYKGSRTYFMGIAGYDDTPRRGRSGECMLNNTPDIFRKGMEDLLIKSIKHANELVFINAWNEWGEGMYLEPDERNGYAYLEALGEAKKAVSGLDKIEEIEKEDETDTESMQLQYEVKKYKEFLGLYDRWLYLERRGRCCISAYLGRLKIEKIAIYGMGMLGKQLYDHLIRSDIAVLYGIDRYVGQYGKNFTIYRPEENFFPAVDAIIITAYEEEKIESLLKGKCAGRIIKLGNMIDNLWKAEWNRE